MGCATSSNVANAIPKLNITPMGKMYADVEAMENILYAGYEDSG